MSTALTTFLITTWLLAMLPGPGQAFMLRQTLLGGRGLAAASIAGTWTGILTWSLVAATGLAAMLRANPSAFLGLRLGGGVVLAGMGLTTMARLRRGRDVAATGPATGPEPPIGSTLWGGYRAGLAVNLSNPKAGVFAVSLLPQFLPPGGPVLVPTVVLGAVWATVTALWYAVFTVAVDAGRTVVTRPTTQRGLQLATGTVLLLLGGLVAAGA